MIKQQQQLVLVIRDRWNPSIHKRDITTVPLVLGPICRMFLTPAQRVLKICEWDVSLFLIPRKYQDPKIRGLDWL